MGNKIAKILFGFIALFFIFNLALFLRSLSTTDQLFWINKAKEHSAAKAFTELFPDYIVSENSNGLFNDSKIVFTAPAKDDYGTRELDIYVNDLNFMSFAGSVICFTKRQLYQQWNWDDGDLTNFLKNDFKTNKYCKE